LSDKPSFGRLVLDYPATAQITPLVGPVARGAAEPAVGCLISWRQTPGAGQAGLVFGVEDRSYLKILVDAGKTLVLDGTDVGGERLVQLLPASLVTAIIANGYQVGLTVRIEKEALAVTVRAGGKKDIEIFKTAFALTTAQRERILDRPMALLSRGGRHEMTPYMNIPRADNGSGEPHSA
jgi:hypothetical protein